MYKDSSHCIDMSGQGTPPRGVGQGRSGQMNNETDQRIDVALVGATGYAGQELVRILARHPRVRLTAALGSASMEAPRKLPALARIWDGEVLPYCPDRIASSVKAAFLALPEANAAETAPELLAR